MVEKDKIKKIIEHFNGRADYNLWNMYIYLKGLINSGEIKRVSAQGMNGGADVINVQKRKFSCKYSSIEKNRGESR